MKELTKEQEQQILEGFANFKAKHGAVSIVWQSSPTQGYWINNQFYHREEILKPFRERLKLKGA